MLSSVFSYCLWLRFPSACTAFRCRRHWPRLPSPDSSSFVTFRPDSNLARSLGFPITESLLNYASTSPSQGRRSRHEMQGFKRNFEWHIKPHIRVFLCATGTTMLNLLMFLARHDDSSCRRSYSQSLVPLVTPAVSHFCALTFTTR